MAETRPRGLDAGRARRLLAAAKAHRAVAARVDALSKALLGCPYEAHGLVGSADSPEVLTASLERFDCVTYVETVLALARSARADDFAGWLRLIRYEGGNVAWESRNHYMTGWIRANIRLGVVRRVRTEVPGVLHERRLDAVPGLPPARVRFACVPKRQLRRLASRLATGDLIFFASTRRNLDVFHCGLLVAGDGGWRLRHATRSRGSVVEEELDLFLGRQRTSGVIVVRPVGKERP